MLTAKGGATDNATVTVNCRAGQKITITSEFVTGNLLVTAETDPGEVMANVWWE